jgi:ATP phosphoribosyltransferase regulatory subunit
VSESDFSAVSAEAGRLALLPAGLRDILAPNAANEARVIDLLMTHTAAHGYDRVKPPLVEFETSLLSGPGAATSGRIFRLMDPVSQRMMGVRADMTVQMARIASSRLKNAPRPLRLCYVGQVLRTTANQLNPERELVQVGAELIGPETAEADAEIVLVAIEALKAAGVSELSVDLMVPPLVPIVLATLGLSVERESQLRAAIDRKDIAAVETLAGDHAPVLSKLLGATGQKDEALAVLHGLDLPADAHAALDRLTTVVELITTAEPGLRVTLDPVENRGFEYHSGIAFSLFARGARGEMVRGEVGRGGRYRVNGGTETATGFTLYIEMVLQALPDPRNRETVFIPHGTPRDEAHALRVAGHVTVQGLGPVEDTEAEARRMGCSFFWQDGKIAALASPS